MPEGVMDKLRTAMLGLPRRHKRAIQVTTDVILVWIALWLAFVVRLGIEVLATPIETHLWLFTAAPLIAIPIFIRFGMYRAVMRYFGNDALITIGKAVSLSALLLALVVYWYSNHEAVVPRSIIFNYWWLSLIMIGGLRLMMRQYFLGDWFAASQHVPFTNRDDGLPKVAIYGAGVAGNQLVAALRMGRVMRPVAFIDDDSSLADRMIAGLQVYEPRRIQKMIDVTGAEEILLAVPSSSRGRRREILTLLEGFPLHVRSVPGFMDLASGRVKVDDIQKLISRIFSGVIRFPHRLTCLSIASPGSRCWLLVREGQSALSCVDKSSPSSQLCCCCSSTASSISTAFCPNSSRELLECPYLFGCCPSWGRCAIRTSCWT